MSETKLDNTYGLLIARVALIHRTRVSGYLTKHNLYVGQEMLLKCLWNQDGLSQKEIADLMGIQAATATRMVMRMEQSGFRPEEERNYQGANYGWQRFLGGLESVVANLE